jgi:hypothetical protein
VRRECISLVPFYMLQGVKKIFNFLRLVTL